MSFLSEYRTFCAGTEAHPTYHMFSGLVALSSIISRRVWIDQGYFKVFPNLYVILVGPPGNRKTSAMSIAKSLIREVQIPFTAECVTKEKLVLDMKENETCCMELPAEFSKFRVYTPMTAMVTELSEFLGAGSVGMINFLVTIYDQDIYESRTKNKGETIIQGPFLNLLACTTPDWITTYLRSDVISGGFSRRAIFVLETGKSGRIPFPEVSESARLSWESVVNYCKQLKKVAGPMTWSPEAREFYADWYTKLEMPIDETIIGYYETKHMQLLKIAMLVSLSESLDRVLRLEHLQIGLDLLKLAEENLIRVFAGMGRNELNSAASKVLSIMDRIPKVLPPSPLPGVPPNTPVAVIFEKKLRGELFHAVKEQEMNEILTHLKNTEKILVLTSTSSGIARSLIILKTW